jgi:hypothetical protein
VSLFVVIPEFEDRDAVEVVNWASTKRPTPNVICILFYLQTDHKKKSDNIVSNLIFIIPMRQSAFLQNLSAWEEFQNVKKDRLFFFSTTLHLNNTKTVSNKFLSI